MTENKETQSMEELLNKNEGNFNDIKVGDVVKGTVLQVRENDVIVNISYISDGVILKDEFTDNADEELSNIAKVGDEIDVVVLSKNDGDGNVGLSKLKAEREVGLKEIEAAYSSGKPLEILLKTSIKGGMTAFYRGIRAFVPISKISNMRIEDTKEFEGKVVKAKVIQFEDKNVVFSVRDYENEQRDLNRDNIIKNLTPGEKVTGTVKNLMKFGAFVDIGGVDGLLHNSNISYDKVTDPSTVVSVGDVIEIYILDVDKKTGKISLSLKDKKDSPWNNVDDNFKTGMVVDGKIRKILEFGMFVEIGQGIDGLVHKSEFSEDEEGRLVKYNEGETVKVKIISIDTVNKKMALSVKEADGSSEEVKKYIEEGKTGFNSTLGAEFGDLFKELL